MLDSHVLIIVHWGNYCPTQTLILCYVPLELLKYNFKNFASKNGKQELLR